MPDILVTSSDRAAIALDLEARNAPEPETLADVAAALGVTLQEAQDPVFLGTLAAEMSWEEGGLGRGERGCRGWRGCSILRWRRSACVCVANGESLPYRETPPRCRRQRRPKAPSGGWNIPVAQGRKTKEMINIAGTRLHNSLQRAIALQKRSVTITHAATETIYPALVVSLLAGQRYQWFRSASVATMDVPLFQVQIAGDVSAEITAAVDSGGDTVTLPEGTGNPSGGYTARLVQVQHVGGFAVRTLVFVARDTPS